jgi:hypothetical protein
MRGQVENRFIKGKGWSVPAGESFACNRSRPRAGGIPGSKPRSGTGTHDGAPPFGLNRNCRARSTGTERFTAKSP